MGIYFDSNGNRHTQQQVDRKIYRAKEIKEYEFEKEHSYKFCEDCGINEFAAGKIDMSHNISVQKAKNMRQVELAWDVENIKLRCRKCHEIYDGLNIK